MTRRAWLLGLAAWGALLAASAARGPDDWDGIGFLESVHDFDLARFHPHPPGYPVYVALLRAAAIVARDPMRAAVVVAVASGVASVALAAAAARRRAGESVGVAVGVLVGVAPLAWHACSGVGSEAPALAFGAMCAWGLASARDARAGSIALGLGVGLGLGTRLSWAPLYGAALVLAPRGTRLRAGGAAVVGCAAWAVPLLAVVGPSRLAAIYTAHLAGHAERWGGTFVTEPGPARLLWLARDVLVDGLGAGADPLGVAIAAAGALSAALAFVAWRRAGWKGLAPVLVVVLPYLAWIALGQNLRDQPRHTLPIVALVCAGLGWRATASRLAYRVTAAFALLLAARAGLDATLRRRIPPPGQQLVDLVRAQPAPDRIAVFGTTSIRFFEGTELASRALPAGSLGDVQIQLARLDRLPVHVWLTNEVETENQTRWPLAPIATLCRPPRLDRRMPCLDVIEWKPPYLPAR